MLTQRVLIADSDPHMQAFVKQALAGRRFRVPGNRRRVRFTTESVASDTAAIQRLAVDAGDVLVVEHRAPGVDGLKVLEALRNLQPRTAAIVAAAHPSIPAAVEAAKLGAFAFLAKPISEKRFHDVLLAAVRTRMECEERRENPLKAPAQSTAGALNRIRAALAHVATAAVSLM